MGPLGRPCFGGFKGNLNDNKGTCRTLVIYDYIKLQNTPIKMRVVFFAQGSIYPRLAQMPVLLPQDSAIFLKVLDPLLKLVTCSPAAGHSCRNLYVGLYWIAWWWRWGNSLSQTLKNDLNMFEKCHLCKGLTVSLKGLNFKTKGQTVWFVSRHSKTVEELPSSQGTRLVSHHFWVFACSRTMVSQSHT